MQKEKKSEGRMAPKTSAPKICRECNKEILGDDYQYTKTKRGTEIFICGKCFRGGALVLEGSRA